jgi:hypothetical protein
MEKKPRKKKVANVELENKIETAEVQNEVTIEQVSLEANKEYTFVSNGKFHTLPKGTVWKMLGSKAEILINKGYGKLK